jgi:hypothetical protein
MGMCVWWGCRRKYIVGVVLKIAVSPGVREANRDRIFAGVFQELAWQPGGLIVILVYIK